jgi:orotidine-5'-phosphate decarboxylase
MPPGAPQSSAADLRELAELGDLLGELAGLVRDLGALIMGLLSAAAGVRERPSRAFAVPPELAELAGAHRELKAEREALSTRLASRAADSADRAALRASVAALTERATRAVAGATAVSFPARPVPVPAPGQAAEAAPASPPPVTAPPGTDPRGASRPPLTDHSREESRVQMQAPVAVALDAPDIDVAAHWAMAVTPYVSTVKIGLELYLRYGPTVVATVRGGSGVQVFLDLKLHDIPNTVAGAARAVAKLRPEILTVHAAGGADMIKAAVQAAPETLVAAVTLLTSIGDKDLADLGVGGSVSDAVRRMAALAVSAGARGLVCSPQEVMAVRAEVGPDILLITPGIRPAGVTSDDQARIATPVEALKAGADLLVIGRPITRASDPGAAAAAIAMSLRHAVSAR